MGRPPRIDVGGYIYHVLNRGVGGQKLFFEDSDFEAFERTLTEAVQRESMRLLAYSVMPNHWHLVLRTSYDGQLRQFMHWLTSTHTARWHTYRDTWGTGHLYQGRYKSFICESDQHLWTLNRYVERNPLRAGLTDAADGWRWSSLWRREHGDAKSRSLLSDWPIECPTDWLARVQQPLTAAELDALRRCTNKELPYGSAEWVDQAIRRFGLESRTRPPGRPRTTK